MTTETTGKDPYEEVVIGFDTRVAPELAAELWDDARRALYLLRADTMPLSVDEAVWPRTNSGLTDGTFEVLTPRFASEQDALAGAQPEEIVVAITMWRGPGEPEVPAGPAWPMKPDPDWVHLGWDVVAGVFPSGLSNCGYDADEHDTWVARFGAALNDHHLFDTLPQAFAFRDQNNRRVHEHAPFAVCGLYRVR